jgi:hypothetical protein
MLCRLLTGFFPWTGASMSNRLSMAQTQAIQALAATGKSNRAISKALGVDRSTVAKTLSQIQNQPPVWEAPTGSGDAPTGFLDGQQFLESESKTSEARIVDGSSSTISQRAQQIAPSGRYGNVHNRILPCGNGPYGYDNTTGYSGWNSNYNSYSHYTSNYYSPYSTWSYSPYGVGTYRPYGC